MKRCVALLAGLMTIDLPVSAEDGVFKCIGADGAIVYQGTPCTARQQQIMLAEPRKREVEPIAVDASGKPGSDASDPGPKRSLLAADELAVGMSDTKVLNMRGWGRPRNIARHRAEDGWREEWTYGSADGATRLVQFLNGKVAAVRSQDAQQIARAAAPRIESPQIVASSAQTSEQRSHEALTIAQSVLREPTESSSRAAPTLQSPVAETVGTAQTYGVSESPTLSQPDARPVDRVTGVSSAHSGSNSAASVHAHPAPVSPVQVESPDPSRQEGWHVIRTEPPGPSEALKSQPHVIIHSSADRQFVRGDDTVSQ